MRSFPQKQYSQNTLDKLLKYIFLLELVKIIFNKFGAQNMNFFSKLQTPLFLIAIFMSMSFFQSAFGFNTENELVEFKKNPLEYANKNIYQTDFIQVLEKLKKDSPEEFTKLCFEKPLNNNPFSQTLLIKLCKDKLWVVSSYLIKNAPSGADLDIKDADGLTALLHCAHPSTMGAKAYEKKYGKRNSKLQEELRSASGGCAPGEGRFLKDLTQPAIELINKGASIEICDKKGRTIVHRMAKYANRQFIFDFSGRSRLDLSHSSREPAPQNPDCPCTKRLSKKDLLKKDNNGDTPLHLYIKCLKIQKQGSKKGSCNDRGGYDSYYRCLHILVENGSNINAQNNLGETPLSIAQNEKVLCMSDTIAVLKGEYFERPSSLKPIIDSCKSYWKPLAILCGVSLLSFLAYRFYLKPKFIQTSLLMYFKKQPNKPQLLLPKTFSLLA